MLADIRALASDIGVRFVGTPGDARAAQYISERFAQNGLQPQKIPFRVMGWSLREDARLEISTPGAGSSSIPCYPSVYSSSTPAEGFRGRLVYWGRQEIFQIDKFRPFEQAKFRFRKYSLLDENGDIVAFVVSRDFPDQALVSAWGVLPLPTTTPTVMIGEQDGRRLEKLVTGGEQIAACVRVRTDFNPAAVTHNIIAELGGSDSRKSEEKILVAAHYDTQYAGPGAVDNASGVAGLLSLCRYFQEKRLKRTLLFAVYGGEEVGFLGAHHHLASLVARQQLSSIRAFVNLDMLACNEPNWIHASEDFLAQESVQRAAKDVGIADKYGSLEIVTPPWPSGDQDPFYDKKIPCVSFTWKGYKYPYTHTPEDTIDKVDAEVQLDSFRLACQVVEHMDRML